MLFIKLKNKYNELFGFLKILLVVLFFQADIYAKDTLFLPMHNFYLSISEIVYKKDIQSFEITIRFFSNDFEESMLAYDHSKIYDANGLALKTANNSIFSYLKEHFIIYDDQNKKIEYQFIGWESEQEHSWCYLEAHHGEFEYLKVKNNLLIEEFASQKNLVYLKYDQKETSILLDKKIISGFLKFE